MIGAADEMALASTVLFSLSPPRSSFATPLKFRPCFFVNVECARFDVPVLALFHLRSRFLVAGFSSDLTVSPIEPLFLVNLSDRHWTQTNMSNIVLIE